MVDFRFSLFQVHHLAASSSFEPADQLIADQTDETLIFCAKSSDHWTQDEEFGSVGKREGLCNATSHARTGELP